MERKIALKMDWKLVSTCARDLEMARIALIWAHVNGELPDVSQARGTKYASVSVGRADTTADRPLMEDVVEPSTSSAVSGASCISSNNVCKRDTKKVLSDKLLRIHVENTKKKHEFPAVDSVRTVMTYDNAFCVRRHKFLKA